MEEKIKGSLELLDKVYLKFKELKSQNLPNEQIFQKLIEFNPSMATVINLSKKLIYSNNPEEEFQNYKKNIRDALRKIYSKIRKKIKFPSKILTYSRSSSVIFLFKEFKKENLDFEVFITEGRPNLEGIKTAEELSKEGIKVTLGVDAIIYDFVKNCDYILLGADAITPNFYINKIGTYPLILTARELKKEYYIIATKDKFLGSEEEKFLRIKKEQPDEVYKGHKRKNIQILNVYFEKIPVSLIANRIISE